MTMKKLLSLMLAFCLIITCLTACGANEEETKSGYELVLDTYFDSVCKNDGDKLVKILFPEEAIEYYTNNGYIDDVIAKCKMGSETACDWMENDLGESISISYKIVSKEKLDDDDIKFYLGNHFRFLDDKIEVNYGYELNLELTIKGQDETEEDVEAVAKIMKINGDWIVASMACYRLNVIYNTISPWI